MDLVTQRNINEVVGVLKKEVMKTQSKDVDRAQEYRQMLIAAIHTCAERFPQVAESVVYVLLDFLGDASGSASAADVVAFVRYDVLSNPCSHYATVKYLSCTQTCEIIWFTNFLKHLAQSNPHEYVHFRLFFV